MYSYLPRLILLMTPPPPSEALMFCPPLALVLTAPASPSVPWITAIGLAVRPLSWSRVTLSCASSTTLLVLSLSIYSVYTATLAPTQHVPRFTRIYTMALVTISWPLTWSGSPCLVAFPAAPLVGEAAWPPVIGILWNRTLTDSPLRPLRVTLDGVVPSLMTSKAYA